MSFCHLCGHIRFIRVANFRKRDKKTYFATCTKNSYSYEICVSMSHDTVIIYLFAKTVFALFPNKCQTFLLLYSCLEIFERSQQKFQLLLEYPIHSKDFILTSGSAIFVQNTFSITFHQMENKTFIVRISDLT